MVFTEQHIQTLAPNPAAFSAGKKLSSKEQWQSIAKNERAMWGGIKGSGANPYLVQIDISTVAYKCTCPSRQFPCKHSIGLMLLYATHASLFASQEEPEWVKSWMDKRVTKEKSKPEEEEKQTAVDVEQLEKNREKTQQNRLVLVTAGAEELELWLKDLVRIGLLELANKTKSDFDRVASRMVDAKAPGLAGWIKSLSKLNYDDQEVWQQEALSIIAKLFLLVQAIKNFEKLTPIWQQTIKNLSGWSQSTKELLADPEVESVKDYWLVAGQELENTEDEIAIQRNWLIGTNTNRQALVLHFGTKYTAIESTILPGTVVEGEFVYFPSVLPNRGAFRIHRQVMQTVEKEPAMFGSWTEVHHYRVDQLKVNPWANDLVVILKKAKMIKGSKGWIVCDEERSYMPVITEYPLSKIMNWVAISGNRAMNMTLVIRNSEVMPLGILDGNKYNLI